MTAKCDKQTNAMSALEESTILRPKTRTACRSTQRQPSWVEQSANRGHWTDENASPLPHPPGSIPLDRPLRIFGRTEFLRLRALEQQFGSTARSTAQSRRAGSPAEEDAR